MKHRKIEGETILNPPWERESPDRHADALPFGVFAAQFLLCDDQITDM